MMFDEIKETLADFGVDFDVYFHENDLHESGAIDRGHSTRLRELGNIYETGRRDLAAHREVRRRQGPGDRPVRRPGAYFSGDAAYYLDKRERGFDRCLIMLGADHHGYVGRMRAMCAAFGDDPDATWRSSSARWSTCSRRPAGADVASAPAPSSRSTTWSTRSASTPPATRWPATHRDSTIDIDLDLWARATSDNPVFYVQYAHARRRLDPAQRRRPRARRRGRRVRPRAARPREGGRAAAGAGRVPARGRRGRRAARAAPGRPLPRGHRRVVPPLLRQLPGAADGRRGAAPTCTGRGCCWSTATRIVLANGLGLLGVSAPERM